MPELRPSFGRTNFQSPTLPRALTVDCPLCGALASTRCFDITSWRRVDGHPEGGFYIERIKKAHPERTAASVTPKPQISDRGALRKQLGVLTLHRLPGSECIAVRAWAASTRRTAEELQAKVDELEQLPEL